MHFSTDKFAKTSSSEMHHLRWPFEPVSAVAIAVAVSTLFSVAAQELFYPGHAKSERDLPACEPYEICSIVHRRYWFANRVERLCRCDGGQDCPNSWSDDSDDRYTMRLNNRAQMKFCEAVTTLRSCLETEASASINSNGTLSRLSQRFLNVINETRIEMFNNVTTKKYTLHSKAECYCPAHSAWITHAFQKNESSASSGGIVFSHTSTSYRCSELMKCKAGDMCGFERTDFYSVYYRCSCPFGYLCLRQNHSIVHQINEMLYEGPAYVTSCQKRTDKLEV